MTIHVDDLKHIGKPEVTKHMLAEFQKVFGYLKVEWHTFTNCDVCHIQCLATYEITLDQNTNAINLRIIAHPQLHGAT